MRQHIRHRLTQNDCHHEQNVETLKSRNVESSWHFLAFPLTEPTSRRRHREFAVLDPFGADDEVGELFDFPALAAHDEDFQAVIMIEMDVHP